MAKKAPGKHYRKGISFVELLDRFPTDRVAEEWFEKTRWPNGVECPRCNSSNIYTRPEEKRRNQPYRCRSCRSDFSAKTGTLMQSSHIGYRSWVVGLYLMATNLKGISSMKLHRDLVVTQKTAWAMMHKIRETFDDHDNALFGGPVEVDETFMGGKETNKHNHKKLKAGRGTIGKSAVIGMKDRETNEVRANVIQGTDRNTLHKFVTENADTEATVYTDDHAGYHGLPFKHEAVKHSVSEYVRDQAHTNGIESHWALMKRGYHGTYHHMSKKHLNRYVAEFAGRHNIRNCDTIVQMEKLVEKMVGKRLTYKQLAK